MPECWLRPNRRALAFGLVLPGMIVLMGLAVAVSLPADSDLSVMRWFGWAGVAIGGTMSAMLVYLMRVPRLGYENGYLLAYLRSTQPIRIPIDVVECFFLGQTPTTIKAPDGAKTEAATVVVRLAESAKDWHHRDVKPALGHWCDGYITIVGTWCEPLNGELLKRLNERLMTAHRDSRANDHQKDT